MKKLLEVALSKIPQASQGEPFDPVIRGNEYGEETLYFLIDGGIAGTKKYQFPVSELAAEIKASASPKPKRKKKKPAPKPPEVMKEEVLEPEAPPQESSPKSKE